MSKPRFLIIPTSEVTHTAMSLVNDWLDSLSQHLSQGKVKVTLPPIDLKEAKQLVNSVCMEALESRLVWVRQKTRSEDELLAIVKRRAGGRLERTVEDFIDFNVDAESIQSIWDVVNPIVMDFVGDRTWHTYHTRLLSNGMLIEEGVDYRIADWTRRMEIGEWKEE